MSRTTPDRTKFNPGATAAALLALCAATLATPALAHPHVWVTVRDEVVFKDGAITGVEQHWTFDEAYTEMAIEGLDKNGDNILTREELSELADTNIEGLKDFDYFTFAKLGDKALPFDAPRDYWLDYDNKILTLHYFLPLKQPIKPQQDPVKITVTDPSIYIAFSFDKKQAVSAKDMPADCKVAIVEAEQSDDQKSLSSAFGTQMVQIGDGIDGAIAVSCAK